MFIFPRLNTQVMPHSCWAQCVNRKFLAYFLIVQIFDNVVDLFSCVRPIDIDHQHWAVCLLSLFFPSHSVKFGECMICILQQQQNQSPKWNEHQVDWLKCHSGHLNVSICARDSAIDTHKAEAMSQIDQIGVCPKMALKGVDICFKCLTTF